jgi:indole-3-glycerol phosphate synthase
MTDYLDTLATDAKATVDSGYYEYPPNSKHVSASLLAGILQSKKAPIIAEVKGASPSKGMIRRDFAPEAIARAMKRGGAVGISVLTEPKHFNGSLDNLARVRGSVDLPILMKDIVVSPKQLDATEAVGANAVLLIQAIFDRGYCSLSLGEMIVKAHSKNLEVLLETHTLDEFARALESDTDLVGINNRNLGTLQIDLGVTKAILSRFSRAAKPVVSESGINTPVDIAFLRGCGAKAFLIGSAVMLADDVEQKVREFVNANN